MSKVGYNLTLINGTPHNPHFNEATIQNLIRTFETRDDDMFICTYVKSGTTWLQQIINLLVHGGNNQIKSFAETAPWLEAAVTGGTMRDREGGGWTLESISNAPGPRFFKTHAHFDDLPRGKAKGLKVIYVARNPKDIIVSLYHQARGKPIFKFDGDYSDMIHYFLNATCANGDWFRHVTEWWDAAQKDPEHILFLKYENLVAEPRFWIERIASFGGFNTSDEILNAVIAKSSFDSMKSDELIIKTAGNARVRQGGVGKWRKIFTVTESDNFDKIYKERMANTGLTFDFGDGLIM